MTDIDEKETDKVFRHGYLKKSDRPGVVRRNLKKLQGVLARIPQEDAGKYNLDHVTEFLGDKFCLSAKSEDIRLYSAVCLSDILRLKAPDSPYDDRTMKGIFKLMMHFLPRASDPNANKYEEYFHLLEQMSSVQTYLLISNFDDDDLNLEFITCMYQVVSPQGLETQARYHVTEIICGFLSSIEEDTPPAIMEFLTNCLIEPARTNNGPQYDLTVEVLRRCKTPLAKPVEKCIRDIIQVDASEYEMEDIEDFSDDEDGDTKMSEKERKKKRNKKKKQFKKKRAIYRQQLAIVAELAGIDSDFMSPVMPYLQDAVEDENEDRRLAFIDMFSRIWISSPSMATHFPQTFRFFLRRYDDVSDNVRRAMAAATKDLLKCQTRYKEFLCDYAIKRLSDHDETVRREMLEAVISAAEDDPQTILPRKRSHAVISALLKRTIDKRPKVRQVALKGLAKLFEVHVRPRWEKNERLPDACRLFMQVPKRMLANLDIVDLNGRIEIEEFFNEFLLGRMTVDVTDDMRRRRMNVLMGIIASIDERLQAIFVKRFVQHKAELQSTVSTLERLFQERRVNPDRRNLGRSIDQFCQVFDSRFDPEWNRRSKEKPSEKLERLLEHKNKKVRDHVSVLADPQSTLADLAAAREELRRICTATDDPNRNRMQTFVRQLSIRLSTTAFSYDCIPVLLTILHELASMEDGGRPQLTRAILFLVLRLSEYFPLLFNDEQSLLVISDLLDSDDDDIYQSALEVFSKVVDASTFQPSEDLITKLLTRAESADPKETRLVVQCLIRLANSNDTQHVAAVYKSCVDRLSIDDEALPGMLSALSVIAKSTPTIFAPRAKRIVKFVVETLLPHVSDDLRPIPENVGGDITLLPEDVQNTIETRMAEQKESPILIAKRLGIDLVVEFLLAIEPTDQEMRRRRRSSVLSEMNDDPMNEDSIENRALRGAEQCRPILKVLLRALDERGNLLTNEIGGACEVERNVIFVESIKAILKLAPRRAYSRFIRGKYYCIMSLSLCHEQIDVRRGVLDCCWNSLRKSEIASKYAAMFGLLAHEPDKKMKDMYRKAFIEYMKRMRRAAEQLAQHREQEFPRVESLPEYLLVYLIYILCEHPDFDADAAELELSTRYVPPQPKRSKQKKSMLGTTVDLGETKEVDGDGDVEMGDVGEEVGGSAQPPDEENADADENVDADGDVEVTDEKDGDANGPQEDGDEKGNAATEEKNAEGDDAPAGAAMDVDGKQNEEQEEDEEGEQQSVVKYFGTIFRFFLTCLLQGTKTNNFPLMFAILSKINNSQNQLTGSGDKHKLLVRIADKELHKKLGTKSWTNFPDADKLKLPQSMFRDAGALDTDKYASPRRERKRSLVSTVSDERRFRPVPSSILPQAPLSTPRSSQSSMTSRISSIKPVHLDFEDDNVSMGDYEKGGEDEKDAEEDAAAAAAPTSAEACQDTIDSGNDGDASVSPVPPEKGVEKGASAKKPRRSARLSGKKRRRPDDTEAAPAAKRLRSKGGKDDE